MRTERSSSTPVMEDRSREPYIMEEGKNDTLRLAFDLEAPLSAGELRILHPGGVMYTIIPYEKAAAGSVGRRLFCVHPQGMPCPCREPSGSKIWVFSPAQPDCWEKHRPAAGGCGLDIWAPRSDWPGGPPPDGNAGGAGSRIP